MTTDRAPNATPQPLDLDETGDRFYIELTNQADAAQVNQALQAAGLSPELCRSTTNNQEGIIITQSLAQGVWNNDTGYNDCKGACTDQAQAHLSYNQLTPEQRAAFVKDLASFLHYQRINNYMPTQGQMDDDETMGQVALEHCREQ